MAPDPAVPRRPVRRETLWRAAGLFRPYRLRISGVVILVLVNAALGVATPLLIRRVIDVAIPEKDTTQLGLLVAGMIGAAALSGAFNMLEVFLNVNVGVRVMQDMRNAVYAHVQRQPLRFFTATRTGDIQSRLANDISGTQSVVTDTLSAMISNSAVVLSSIVAMIVISWQLSVVALAIFPVFLYLTVRVGRTRRKLTRETQRSLADLTAITGETLSVSGVMLAKTFGREQEHRRQFEANNRELTALSLRRQLTGRAFFVIVTTFFAATPAVIWWLGGILIANGAAPISVGGIVAFTTLQVRLLFPLSGLLNRTVEITSSLALFDRVFEYLDLESDIKDPENPVPVVPAAVRGEVRFKHVRFHYREEDGNKTFSLEDVDFTVEPGSLTAIVGPSGSGKTTVGYLLSRLYDVDDGAVCIDGVDIRRMRLVDLNRIIGVVTQDPFLFHASVADNLRYGRPDATRAQMEAAARAAQIHATIMDLPDGYETVVGERGYRLSGGERQRISIARVVLANPRILLLDEATSSLDTLSERMIQHDLTRIMAGRTTIAIAHRLSTIMAADTILVMNGGRIVEEGSHQELLARSGLYRRLYEEQFRTGPPRSVSVA